MKRIFLLVLMFSMFSGMAYADECISGDCQNGQGTMKYGNKDKCNESEYVGEFKNGQRNGQGTMIYQCYPSGSIKYVGQFKDDKYNGQGTMTYPDGRKDVGQWEDGEFKDDKKIEQEKDESDSIKANDETLTQQPTAEELAYQADTATILKLLGNIRDYRKNGEDTQVQANARERKLKKALVQINSRYKGTSLTLQRAKLKDITADTVLSAKGIVQSRQIIAKIRQDPESAALTDDLLAWTVGLQLAFCPDCWKESGKYKATYSIPVPGEQYRYGIAVEQQKNNDGETPVYEEYLDVKIVKIYPNESSVINLNKGSVSPLTGTIRNILYEDIDDQMTIEID